MGVISPPLLGSPSLRPSQTPARKQFCTKNRPLRQSLRLSLSAGRVSNSLLQTRRAAGIQSQPCAGRAPLSTVSRLAVASGTPVAPARFSDGRVAHTYTRPRCCDRRYSRGREGYNLIPRRANLTLSSSRPRTSARTKPEEFQT